jgi:hypothetical protein
MIRTRGGNQGLVRLTPMCVADVDRLVINTAHQQSHSPTPRSIQRPSGEGAAEVTLGAVCTVLPRAPAMPLGR